MNAEQLLQNFDRIAESPGSIAHLRRFILDLAVRGKLVEQVTDPVYLLQQIQAEKERLVREGKIEKQKPRPPLTDEEIPVLYADHCVYERLGNVAILQKGLTGIQRSKSGSFPLVVTAEDRSSCDHFDFEGAYLLTVKGTDAEIDRSESVLKAINIQDWMIFNTLLK